jgi:hypothetical protein
MSLKVKDRMASAVKCSLMSMIGEHDQSEKVQMKI